MASLPSYVAAAKPVPLENRAAWHHNTAPAYAGIVLWFVFWQDIAGGGGTPGGVLAEGLPTALLALVLAAVICYSLFFLVPGMLGMKSGLPLYVVGTSTYGVQGGLLMPGFLMGLLQFGWLAVNAFAVGVILCKCFAIGLDAKGDVIVPGPIHGVIAAVFVAGSAMVGLKGIQYVGKVATYLPLIPFVLLIILLAKSAGGLGAFTPEKVIGGGKEQAAAAEAVAAETVAPEEGRQAAPEKVDAGAAPCPLNKLGVIAMLCTFVVGFFATAGAAGVDFGMNNRDESDVQCGGLVGIVLATVFAGGMAMLIVAGAYGAGLVPADAAGSLNPITLMKGGILTVGVANVFMILLAVSSFPPACFSSFIAANSFRTTLPNVNPWLSVGCGTAVAVILAVSGVAGKVIAVFVVIGASFGPVCGAMAADYLLSGRKWAGPRAGFNPAGWISWIVGFAIGAADFIAKIPGLEEVKGKVPAPPVAAFLVGFVLYYLLAKAGLESKSLEMPPAGE